MPATKHRVAVVTGANRGIGFETCRQLADQGLHVVLTARDATKAQRAADSLAADGRAITSFPVDVTVEATVRALAEHLEQTHGRVDVLVNNAGVILDHGEGAHSVLTARPDVVRDSMETNLLGPMRLCQALVPLMRRGGYGRVVNVSTGMAQLSEMDGGWPGYRMSKTALNALTRIVASETASDNILVNAVCPGWVRTDLGGKNAPRSVEEGAAGIVWAATLPDGGPTGGFFRDRQPIAW